MIWLQARYFLQVLRNFSKSSQSSRLWQLSVKPSSKTSLCILEKSSMISKPRQLWKRPSWKTHFRNLDKNLEISSADHEVKFQNTILQLDHQLEQQHKFAKKDNELEKKEKIKEDTNPIQLNSEMTDQVRKTSNAIHKQTDTLGKSGEPFCI